MSPVEYIDRFETARTAFMIFIHEGLRIKSDDFPFFLKPGDPVSEQAMHILNDMENSVKKLGAMAEATYNELCKTSKENDDAIVEKALKIVVQYINDSEQEPLWRI